MHGQKVKSKQDKLKELLNYVDAHYAGPITIRDASLRLGVTNRISVATLDVSPACPLLSISMTYV